MVLIDERLNYIRRDDLESSHDCTIWIEIKVKRQKSILICSGYRQWDTPYEGRKTNEGSLQKYNSVKCQLLRYKSILKN